MIDESMDINATHFFVMFATIIEDSLSITILLGFLQLQGSKKEVATISDYVIS